MIQLHIYWRVKQKCALTKIAGKKCMSRGLTLGRSEDKLLLGDRTVLQRFSFTPYLLEVLHGAGFYLPANLFYPIFAQIPSSQTQVNIQYLFPVSKSSD